MKEYKDNIDLDDIMFDNGADKEDKLEEKACNEVDLPGLGKMEFLPSGEEDYILLKTVTIGISKDSADHLNENEAKREEFSKSYEAFWTCGSKVSDNNVNYSIGIFSHKSEKPVRITVGSEFCSFFSKIGNHKFRFQNWACSGVENLFPIVSTYFKNSSFFVIDGYCDSVFKEKFAEMIDSKEIEAGRVVFIKRYDNEGKVIDEKGTKALGDQLQKSGFGGNVVDGRNYEALAEKGKKMYTKLLSEHVSKDITMTKDKKIVVSNVKGFKHKKYKKHKNGFSKLLNAVKENKGKTMFTLFGLLGLEELWRNGFFSGDKTNEKEKAKNLKKLFEQKDADKYPNRKDKNSAST